MTDTEYRDEAVVQTLELDRRDVDDEGSAPKPPMRLRFQLGSGAPFSGQPIAHQTVEGAICQTCTRISRLLLFY